jgi:transcriptional regulator with XRE-family HTH domain
MSDTPQTINGELLRLKRESLGWLISDLATRACMSIKQIKQLEEGGSSSFYSESVKLTSAKKVGAILGLTQDEVFGVVTQEPEVAAQDADAMVAEMVSDTPAQGVMSHTAEPAANLAEVTTDAPQVQSESHMLSASSPEVAAAPSQNAAAPVTEQKNKTPLGAIAALFVAALAVAAWMRPESEPVAVEPPPPLQTLPADTPDGAASAASAEAAATPASAASSASSSASAASPAVTPAQTQASAAPVTAKTSAVPAAPSASAAASKPL